MTHHREIARRLAHLKQRYLRRQMQRWQYLRFIRCILAEFGGGSGRLRRS